MKTKLKMKYSDIKDIRSLDTAREIVSNKIGLQKEKLLSGWEETKQSFMPASLVASAIKSISDAIPFDKIALYAIRSIKNKLKEKPSEETAEETNTTDENQ